MKKGKMHNFIIHIILLAIVVSVIGVGFDGSRLVSRQSDSADIMKCIVETELLSDDNVNNIQIVERGRVLVSVWQMRVVRGVFSYRAALYYLCALVFLSGLFLFSLRERFILYGNRYVAKVCYQVDYIENQDGRKKSHHFFTI
ncbi:MAG: hypothetical protein ACI4F4_04815 [Lachnospiraceae bacterium]